MDGTPDVMLMLAAWCAALLAATAALGLCGRIAFSEGWNEKLWLAAGALVLGSGICAADLLSLKSLGWPLALSFDLRLTALSWLAAVSLSALALYWVSRVPLGTANLAGGGVVMGLCICLMHYSGMQALRLTLPLAHDAEWFSASVFIAVAASIAALGIGLSVRRLPLRPLVPARLAGALLMGTAICGTQYAGLASAKIPAGAVCAPGNLVSGTVAGVLVDLFGAGALLLVTLLTLHDARRVAGRRRAEWARAVGRFTNGLASG